MNRAAILASLAAIALGLSACDKPADTGADTDSLDSNAAGAGGGTLVTPAPTTQAPEPAGPLPGNAAEAVGSGP